MAITDGSKVSVKNLSTDFTGIGEWTAQPPISGIAFGSGESGDFNILWENGLQASSVAPGALDEIVTATDESLLLFGKTVTVGPSSSPSYESLVVAVYNRSGAEVALLKSTTTGTYREVAVDQVVPVSGH